VLFNVIPKRLIAVLLILGLAFLAGYFAAWSLSLLVVVLGALLLERAFGVYRALPALLLLTIGTAFLLGGGLSLPVAFRTERPLRETIHTGIVSGTAPAEIIVRVGQLVDSRRVPADSAQRISRGLDRIDWQVEDLRVRIVGEHLTSIRAKVEAQGTTRRATERAEEQARDPVARREEELTDQLATKLAGDLTQEITSGRVWSFFGRGLLAAAIAAVVSSLVCIACAEVLIVHRGGDRSAAYRMVLGLLAAPLFPTGNPLGALFFGITQSFRALQIVQDGRVIFSRPSSDNFQMPGPGMLIIRSGSAAVLERAGRITRVVGPGFYLTESFEHLSAIVDLSLQSESWNLDDVLTRDGVPLGVELTVQYRIMIDQPALIAKAEYRLDEDVVRRVVLTTADWNEQTKLIAESILRDTIAARFLDEIYDPRGIPFKSGATPPRVRLQHELRRRLGRKSQPWGVEMVRVNLDKITLPLEVKQRMIEAWDVAWHDEVEVARAETERARLRTRGQGEADVIRTIEAAIADARERLIDQALAPIYDGRIPDPDLARRYLTALENLGSRIMAEDVTAVRYVEALERLAESGSLRLIGPGATQDILISLDE
jgi:regulator of protease activity HflC (stomatin/prohibitin superfamily)